MNGYFYAKRQTGPTGESLMFYEDALHIAIAKKSAPAGHQEK